MKVFKPITLFYQLKGYGKIYFICFLFLLFNTFTALLLPYLTGIIVDLVRTSTLENQYDVKNICFSYLIITFFIVFLGHMFGSYAVYRLAASAEKIADSVRRKIVKCNIPEDTKSITFKKYDQLGKITSLLSTDVDIMWDFYGYAIAEMFVAITTIITMSLIIAYMNFVLGIISFFITAIFAISYSNHGIQVRVIFKKIGNFYEDMIDFVSDYYPAMHSIISYKCKEWVIKNFNDKSESVCKEMNRAHRKVTLFNFWTGLSFIIFTFSLWTYSIPSLLDISGTPIKLTVGEFITLLLYIAMLQQPLSTISNCSKVFNRAIVSLERINSFLKPYETSDKPGTIRSSSGNPEAYALQVCNLFVSPQKNKTIIKDINLNLFVGECLGITGVSGSGKSTLIKAIARLVPYSSGQIFLNNVHLEQIDESELRESIVYVEQEPFYLKSSIYNNITLGENLISRNSIESSLEKVGLKERVKNLTDGLNYNGTNIFSGGEKQRFNLARAFARDRASIYIFDEPTSSLDESNQQRIIKYINDLKKQQKSIIVVTHSNVVLKECDRILMMQEGEGIVYSSYKQYDSYVQGYKKTG
ncbi:MAG: ABC transporter ATP-binding protein/permease [Alphaproteobacteria bacterium]|nr:ABC transporter ATP-binding protein/permease [Alphaproteobacteria bacterium]